MTPKPVCSTKLPFSIEICSQSCKNMHGAVRPTNGRFIILCQIKYTVYVWGFIGRGAINF